MDVQKQGRLHRRLGEIMQIGTLAGQFNVKGQEMPERKMSEGYVARPKDLPVDGWDDVRGTISWQSMVSADRHPSDSLSGGTALLEPGKRLAIHHHEPSEIYFIAEGRGIVTINGIERAVTAGDGVFIPGNAQHGIAAAPDSALRFFYVLAAGNFADIDYVFA
jgi:quercetin dioxygenase-like cupin family protein